MGDSSRSITCARGRRNVKEGAKREEKDGSLQNGSKAFHVPPHAAHIVGVK